MKTSLWISLVIGTVALSGAVSASEGVDEVLRLQQGGVNPRVISAYVENSPTAYDLSADEIQKLEDAGVPATVVVAMIDHGKALRNEPIPSAPAPQNAASDAAPRAATSDSASAAYDAPPPTESVASADTVVYAPPKEDANISFFYQSMAPYGEWHRHSSYGWVWQPRVMSVDVDWRPYAQGGHWVWSDHGWYWESTYPWGWAAFHYGRWHRDEQLSWVWVPDTEWGPSWVSWRSCDEAYAWAPLPPEARFETGVGFSFHDKHVGLDFHFGLGERDYSIVPAQSFLALDVGTVVLRPERARTVYNKTTIVNNTYVYNDNRIINNGISTRDVAARTNTRIETVTIADSRVSAGQPLRGEVRQNNTIVAYRPAIARAAPKDPPAPAARVAVNSRSVTQQVRYESDAQSRLAREKAVRVSSAGREATREDDGARRQLGLEKQRREAETGESHKTVNADVKREHQDDIAAERDARRKLSDEKARRESDDRGRDAVDNSPRRIETADKRGRGDDRDSDERSSRGSSDVRRVDNPGQARHDVANDDDDARGRDKADKPDKSDKGDKGDKGKAKKSKK